MRSSRGFARYFDKKKVEAKRNFSVVCVFCFHCVAMETKHTQTTEKLRILLFSQTIIVTFYSNDKRRRTFSVVDAMETKKRKQYVFFSYNLFKGRSTFCSTHFPYKNFRGSNDDSNVFSSRTPAPALTQQSARMRFPFGFEI